MVFMINHQRSSNSIDCLSSYQIFSNRFSIANTLYMIIAYVLTNMLLAIIHRDKSVRSKAIAS